MTTRAVEVAAGFALGAGLFGIVASVATAVSGPLPSDAEGSVGAAVLFGVLGFGTLAIVGGVSAGGVVGVFGRRFFDVTGRGALGIGVVAGVAVALSASFGVLRFFGGKMFIPSMIAGAIAGFMLLAAAAALRIGHRPGH